MALGHVLGQGCEAALAVASLVTGDPLVFEQDLHRGGG